MGGERAIGLIMSVVADIPNYTDVKPVSVGGALVGGN